jgi:hypothetical protein
MAVRKLSRVKASQHLSANRPISSNGLSGLVVPPGIDSGFVRQNLDELKVDLLVCTLLFRARGLLGIVWSTLGFCRC